MSLDNLLKLEPCTSKCHGRSCCNCCGRAPGLHKGFKESLFQPYDRGCCRNCRREKPEQCMFLQGRLRNEWIKEDFNGL